MTKPYRYVALDSYRFLAASGVVLFHYDSYFDLGLAGFIPPLRHFNNFVDFFFLLSGFVIAAGYADRLGGRADYLSFLRARFARLYPLHLATLAFSLLLAGLGALLSVHENHPEVVALSNLPANLALMHSWGFLGHLSFNGPSWSISTEWFLYLIAPVLLALAHRLSGAASMALTCLFLAGAILFRKAMGLDGDWLDASWDFGVLRGVPTFYAGFVIARVVATKPIAWTPPWWCVHGLFVVAIALLGAPVPRECAIVVFGLLVLTAALADRGGAASIVKSRLLASLGDASYGVYMIHYLLAVPMLFALRRLDFVGTRWMLAFALLAYLGSLGLAILSYRYFETPARKWIVGARAARGTARIVAGERPVPLRG